MLAALATGQNKVRPFIGEECDGGVSVSVRQRKNNSPLQFEHFMCCLSSFLCVCVCVCVCVFRVWHCNFKCSIPCSYQCVDLIYRSKIEHIKKLLIQSVAGSENNGEWCEGTRVDKRSHHEKTETVAPISFPLPEVCLATDQDRWCYLDWTKGKHITCVGFRGAPCSVLVGTGSFFLHLFLLPSLT